MKSLPKQTLKDVEKIHRDIAEFDMSPDEFKDLCRKDWEEKLNYLHIDRSKAKNEGKHNTQNQIENTYIKCT